jgi:heme exporter protein D
LIKAYSSILSSGRRRVIVNIAQELAREDQLDHNRAAS